MGRTFIHWSNKKDSLVNHVKKHILNVHPSIEGDRRDSYQKKNEEFFWSNNCCLKKHLKGIDINEAKYDFKITDTDYLSNHYLASAYCGVANDVINSSGAIYYSREYTDFKTHKIIKDLNFLKNDILVGVGENKESKERYIKTCFYYQDDSAIRGLIVPLCESITISELKNLFPHAKIRRSMNYQTNDYSLITSIKNANKYISKKTNRHSRYIKSFLENMELSYTDKQYSALEIEYGLNLIFNYLKQYAKTLKTANNRDNISDSEIILKALGNFFNKPDKKFEINTNIKPVLSTKMFIVVKNSMADDEENYDLYNDLLKSFITIDGLPIGDDITPVNLDFFCSLIILSKLIVKDYREQNKKN